MSTLRALVLSVAVCAAGASAARADHWMQTADPQVVSAINELLWVYGSACQQGNQAACQQTQMMQQQADMMLEAGYDCQTTGNPQACQFYNDSYAQLEQAYMVTQQAMQQGRMGMPQQGQTGMPQQGYGGYAAGSSHQQRMDQIQQWGQQRLDWGRQQQQMMDQRHQQFMETLRE